MHTPNRSVEKLLEEKHQFSGIADYVHIHAVPNDFKKIEENGQEIFAKQFDSFYRYSYKQK